VVVVEHKTKSGPQQYYFRHFPIQVEPYYRLVIYRLPDPNPDNEGILWGDEPTCKMDAMTLATNYTTKICEIF
jgi:hypothetical protein